MPHIAYIATGSNLGSPDQNCLQAAERLGEHPDIDIITRSCLYQSEPYGKTDQSAFVNSVIKVNTSLTPENLLDACLSIEQDMGRVRKEKWGPRVIDLDILFYDESIIKQGGLDIPHPGIPERSFVLMPMNEIAPDFMHPVLKKTINTLLQEIPNPQEITIHSSIG